MSTLALSRSAPALSVWKTQLKSTDSQILQVQFGLFPICWEGGWDWTRLLVVCTSYLTQTLIPNPKSHPKPNPKPQTQPTRNPNPLGGATPPQTPCRDFGTGGATDRAGGLRTGKAHLTKIYLNPYTLIGARMQKTGREREREYFCLNSLSLLFLSLFGFSEACSRSG